MFALTDGELADRGRALVLGPDGAEWADVRTVPEQVRAHLLAVVRGGGVRAVAVPGGGRGAVQHGGAR